MNTGRLVPAALLFVVMAIIIVSCSDDENGVTPPPGLSLNQSIPTLTAGDSVMRTISGGAPPYSVVSPGNTSIAVATISGTTLTVRAVADGSSTFVIGDTESRTLSVSVQVGVQPVSFAGQVQPIFTTNCAVSGCHVSGGLAPFSLASGSSWDNLVNESSTTSLCSFLRVKPSDADSSVLYRRISGTSCGPQMPQGGAPLSAGNQQLIRDWINQGALNN